MDVKMGELEPLSPGEVLGRRLDWGSDSSSSSSVSLPEEDILERNIEKEVPSRNKHSCCLVLLVILSTYTFSFAIMSLNKNLFRKLHFPFEALVTFTHCAFMSFFVSLLFTCKPSLAEGMGRMTRQKYIRCIIPISICTALDVTLSNEAYKLVGVTVMMVIKSSAVVFVYLLGVCFGLERFSRRTLCLSNVICIGICVSVPGMDVESYWGVLLVFLAVLLASLRWTLLHYQLQDEKYTPLQLMLLTQSLAALFLSVPVGLYQLPQFIAMLQAPSNHPGMFSAFGLISCTLLLAIGLVFSEFWLVQLTSSLSLSVVGTGRELVGVLLAKEALSEPVPSRSWVGIGISLGSILYYAFMRNRQMKSEANYLPTIRLSDSP